MKGALIILLVTTLVGVALYIADRRQRRHASPSAPCAPAVSGGESADGECCGRHLVCRKSPLIMPVTEPVYFDDEELDAFAGRPASDYTAAETEMFRQVLYTMRPAEVAEWVASLQARRIEPPEDVRDEILLLLRDL